MILNHEETFYEKKFYFSYSGLNKLLFCPKLFYNHYILNQQEEKTDLHLVEGKLLHCLLLDPLSFEDNFIMMPGNVPGGQGKVVVDKVYRIAVETNRKHEGLESFEEEILSVLKDINLHQKLSTDAQRVAKILTADVLEYYKFLQSREGKDIIDADTYMRVRDLVNVIKENDKVMDILEVGDEIFSETKLKCELKDYPFGIHGIIDRYKRVGNKYHIIDLKTTGKTIADFKETIEFYNYWLQAAIYVTLLSEEKKVTIDDINFSFLVIDKYQQVYCFNVTKNTMLLWIERLNQKLKTADYHYTNRYYLLPYEFATDNIEI